MHEQDEDSLIPDDLSDQNILDGNGDLKQYDVFLISLDLTIGSNTLEDNCGIFYFRFQIENKDLRLIDHLSILQSPHFNLQSHI